MVLNIGVHWTDSAIVVHWRSIMLHGLITGVLVHEGGGSVRSLLWVLRMAKWVVVVEMWWHVMPKS